MSYAKSKRLIREVRALAKSEDGTHDMTTSDWLLLALALAEELDELVFRMEGLDK